MNDPLLSEAFELVMRDEFTSISRMQRRMRIGYTRAARMIETLENLGLILPGLEGFVNRPLSPTFECHWCKTYAGLEPEEYTYKIEYFAGFSDEGKPICDGCMDSALSVSDFYETDTPANNALHHDQPPAGR